MKTNTNPNPDSLMLSWQAACRRLRPQPLVGVDSNVRRDREHRQAWSDVRVALLAILVGCTVVTSCTPPADSHVMTASVAVDREAVCDSVTQMLRAL